MNETSHIRNERDGQIARLVLDRPAAANAINEAMHAGLVNALEAAAGDASIEAVVLTAAGDRVFSAGADLKEIASHADGSIPLHSAQRASDLLLRTLLALLDFPKPLICAVQAKAIGAGAMLALTCDEIIASEQASFWFPEIGLGMPSPMSVAIVETRAPALVQRLVQRGETIDSAQACAAGLVNAVVPHAQLLQEALRVAQALKPGRAFSANKRWIHRDRRQRLIEAAEESARLRRGQYA